jgi:hypothetical protein
VRWWAAAHQRTGHEDGAKPAAMFTPDPVKFDGGKHFTGSGLWDLIKTVHAKGIRLV